MSEISERAKNRFCLKTLFNIFFHLTLCLMLLDWACPIKLSIGSFGVYEFCLTGLAVCFAVLMITEKFTFFGKLAKIFSKSKALTVFLVLYITAGIITVFYGADIAFGATRYWVVVQMIFFGITFLYYLDGGDYIKRLKISAENVGITSVLIAIIGFIGYYSDGYTYYYQRISVIRDYNQYATILIVGLICIVFTVSWSGQRLWKRYLMLIIPATIVSTATYLAESRRSSVILCVLGIVLLCYLVAIEIKRNVGAGRIAGCIFSVVLCSLCVIASAGLSYEKVGEVGASRMEAAAKALYSAEAEDLDPETLEKLMLAGEQKDLADIIEGMADGSGISSRNMIWNVALNKIRGSDVKHILLGYGASYSWELYDDWDSPEMTELSVRYYRYRGLTHWMNPHNIFLQDMLEGGVVLLLLQLSVLFICFIYMLKLFRSLPHITLPLFLISLVLLVTLVLSCGSGMISNKFFWLIIFILVSERYYTSVYGEKAKEAAL